MQLQHLITPASLGEVPNASKVTDLMHLFVVHWGLRKRHLQEHE